MVAAGDSIVGDGDGTTDSGWTAALDVTVAGAPKPALSFLDGMNVPIANGAPQLSTNAADTARRAIFFTDMRGRARGKSSVGDCQGGRGWVVTTPPWQIRLAPRIGRMGIFGRFPPNEWLTSGRCRRHRRRPGRHGVQLPDAGGIVKVAALDAMNKIGDIIRINGLTAARAGATVANRRNRHRGRRISEKVQAWQSTLTTRGSPSPTWR